MHFKLLIKLCCNFGNLLKYFFSYLCLCFDISLSGLMIISNCWPLLINILFFFKESNDGQSMMEFRRSLPANKERQSLLEAISQNQVLLFSRLFHVTNITSKPR
jgi:hypothetical protein